MPSINSRTSFFIYLFTYPGTFPSLIVYRGLKFPSLRKETALRPWDSCSQWHAIRKEHLTGNSQDMRGTGSFHAEHLVTL